MHQHLKTLHDNPMTETKKEINFIFEKLSLFSKGSNQSRGKAHLARHRGVVPKRTRSDGNQSDATSDTWLHTFEKRSIHENSPRAHLPELV